MQKREQLEKYLLCKTDFGVVLCVPPPTFGADWDAGSIFNCQAFDI